MVSCPVMTEEGQVFALAQKSSGADTATICYAVDADFAMDQNVSAFSFSDMTLKNIGIKKALPDTEEQALVFLFMASSQVAPEKYAELLDDFIAEYPNSADGYVRRATNRIYRSKDDARWIRSWRIWIKPECGSKERRRILQPCQTDIQLYAG